MDFHLVQVNVRREGVVGVIPHLFIQLCTTLLQLASPVPRPVDPSDFALYQFYSDETEVNRLSAFPLFYSLARIYGDK